MRIARSHLVGQRFGELVTAALPFVALMLIALVLVAWQPWIAMGLVR